MVYQWLSLVQSFLFPATCRLCRAPGQPGLELCAPCASELPWLLHACRRCALPLPPESPATHCPACQKSCPPIHHCKALFVYQGAVATWIQDLKFNRDLYAAGLFGRLLADALPTNHDSSTVIVPVPLHRTRLAERGYNQALEIARPLAARGYPLRPRYCRRVRPTVAQSGLPAARRRANLRDAFRVTRRLDGQRVILIDDVMTTGSTLNTLASLCREAGARRVDAVVLARTAEGGAGRG
jgi:ComF family protein